MRFKDLTGEKFGQLTVIKKLLPQVGRTVKWICECECGNESIVRGSNLSSCSTKSCGQHLYESLIGKRFGRLITLEKGKGYKHRNGISTTWICQCDCGNKVDIIARQLTSGRIRSCGCLRKQLLREKSFKGYKEISGKYWSTVISGARKRCLDFSITKEYIWYLYEKQNKKCNLSGIDIIFDLDYNRKTASIDRIDNNKGYIIGNVQILHTVVNKMKNNLKQEDFIEYCRLISNNKI